MKKRLMIATLLSAGLMATPLMAEDSRDSQGCERGENSRMMKHHEFGKRGFGMGGKMDRKEMFEREFNADQIRTLMEARLLMQGNDNLKVGKISNAQYGYVVNIVTQDNSLVEELEVAANGMPKKMYEKMKKHMEKRQQKDRS